MHDTYAQRDEQGLATRHISTEGDDEIQGSTGPSCTGLCLVGGEKAHNEMQRILELSPKTYFRVWLFQQTPENREFHYCANY